MIDMYVDKNNKTLSKVTFSIDVFWIHLKDSNKYYDKKLYEAIQKGDFNFL